MLGSEYFVLGGVGGHTHKDAKRYSRDAGNYGYDEVVDESCQETLKEPCVLRFRYAQHTELLAAPGAEVGNTSDGIPTIRAYPRACAESAGRHRLALRGSLRRALGARLLVGSLLAEAVIA